MFICNFKLNKKKISKIILIVAGIICFILLSLAIAEFVNKLQNNTAITTVSDVIPSPEVANLTE